MKKLVLTVLAVALMGSMALAKDKAQKINGWINDAKCGAKVSADCAKKCAEAGEKLVVVSDKDHKVYQVENQDAVKDHAGHHVTVTATDNNGTLHVDKVDMMKDQTAPAAAKDKPGL